MSDTLTDNLPHETLALTPAQHYIRRVALIKNDLPLNYRKVMYKHYPGLNTPKKKTLIRNVVAGKQSNIFITELLEKIARRELV